MWSFLLLTPVARAEERVVLYPTQEASIFSRYPNRLTDQSIPLSISRNSLGTEISILILDFDLSSLPASSNILSANLVLARQPISDSTFVPFTGSLLSEAWTEQSVTWNKRPARQETNFPISTEELMLGGQPYTALDLTKILQAWLTNGGTAYGLQLAGSDKMEYVKKYYNSQSEVPPRLIIEYSPPVTASETQPQNNQEPQGNFTPVRISLAMAAVLTASFLFGIFFGFISKRRQKL